LALPFVVAILALSAPAARADYNVMADGYAQWDWAYAQDANRIQLADAAVRPDGKLIVATWATYDGFMHLLPRWRSEVGEWNRFGPASLPFRQLEIRQGKLYGLGHREEGGRYGEDEQHRSVATLIEMDLETGVVLRDLGEFWDQDLALDPQTGDLVLQTVTSVDPFAHELIRLNPDNGLRTTLLHDTDTKGDDPMELAFSPDGGRLFIAHLVGSTIDAYDRAGRLLYTLQTGQPIDALVHGDQRTCYRDSLVFTRTDGTVWAVRTTPNATATTVAAAGRAAATSYLTLDADGYPVVPRLVDVTLLACRGFVPPVRPADAEPAPASRALAPQAATQARAPVPPAGRAPAISAPAQPPQAPLAGPPSMAAGGGGAAQTSLGSQASMVDVREEQPILGLSASRRELPMSGAWGFGALAAIGLAAWAFTAIDRPDVRIAPTSARR
jgi:hypothetical protein